jgi:hypothetical protein
MIDGLQSGRDKMLAGTVCYRIAYVITAYLSISGQTGF